MFLSSSEKLLEGAPLLGESVDILSVIETSSPTTTSHPLFQNVSIPQEGNKKIQHKTIVRY